MNVAGPSGLDALIDVPTRLGLNINMVLATSTATFKHLNLSGHCFFSGSICGTYLFSLWVLHNHCHLLLLQYLMTF